jgi:hypothetical protein
MTGKEISNQLLAFWEPIFENEGFNLKSKKYTNDNPLTFEKKLGSANISYYIRFLKYGKVEPNLKISFDETDALYSQLVSKPSQKLDIFHFNILNYLNPENQNDYYISMDYFENPHRNDIMNGVNLENAAKTNFETLFIQTVPKIIERIGTLQKADEVLNNKPIELIKNELKPRWLTYSPNIIFQSFSGILVAKANKRVNFNEVFDQYLSFLEKIKEDDEKEGDYDEEDEDYYWNILMKNLIFLKGE